MDIYKKIINTKPRYPEGFDSDLKSLTKHLLRRDLSKRYGNLKNGSEDIKGHRFFAELSFDDLLQKKLKVPYMPDTKNLKETPNDWEKERMVGSKAVKKTEDPFTDW